MGSHTVKHIVHPPHPSVHDPGTAHAPPGTASDELPRHPPSAPPLAPGARPLPTHHDGGPHSLTQPAEVQVQPPQLETQPWVYDLVAFLKRTTRGMVRVDLRRPTLPAADTLGNNIFVTRSLQQRPRAASQQRTEPWRNYYNTPYSKFPNENEVPGQFIREQEPTTRHSRFSGARLKITRHVSLFTPPDGGRPLLDLSLGANFDMDTQRLQPVARLKVKDWLAVKAVPLGVLRAGRSFRIGEKLAIKAAYELPLEAAMHPLAPPARFMLRLDNFAGAGIHLSPTAIEFDQRVIALGSNVTMRVSGSLIYPRQLPLDPDRDGAFFEWKIHRLGLKTAW